MLHAVLHAGHGHPELLWLVVASILTFSAGLAVGTFADRLRELLQRRRQLTDD